MKTGFLTSTILAFLVTIIMFGCTKEAVSNHFSASDAANSKLTSSEDRLDAAAAFKTYTIQAGNHFADGRHFQPFSGDSLFFSAIFDSSAIYHFTDPNTKYDQNTLYGFADNGDSHLNFSARFGWRWFNNKLQIAAYTFNNSDSTIIEMAAVPLNKVSNYSIVVSRDHYEFTVNKKTLSLPRLSTSATAGPYKLFPYFGGDATAPHTVTIQIKNK